MPGSPDAPDDPVRLGDPDELVRVIDRLCGRGAYHEVERLRQRCHAATEELGKQLWGPARYAEYRLALEAPADLAAAVVTPGAGRFALGPLTEVVAQDHRFDELADELDPTVRAVVAQERVIRGEDLHDDPRASLEDVGLPGVLQPWEPTYPVPRYRAAERLEPESPVAADPGTADVHAPGTAVADHGLTDALRELVAGWEGAAPRIAVVRGGVEGALGAVCSGPVRLTRLTLPEALARMAWAAGSGASRGRRRGAAAGRASAWWVGHVAAGLPAPADPDELEYHLEELTWYAFDEEAGRTGWQLRLAIAGAGWAAAVVADDAHEDEDDHAG
jgi:hypothetical protein